MNRLGWHWWPGMNAIATRNYRNLHACGQRTACPLRLPDRSKGSVDRTHWRSLDSEHVGHLRVPVGRRAAASTRPAAPRA